MSKSSQSHASKRKLTTNQTFLKEERVREALKSHSLADMLISNVSQAVFLAFGISAALLFTVGAANFAHPPKFSIGSWFDDQFPISAVFGVFLLLWLAEQVKEYSDKRLVVLITAGFYFFGGIALISKSLMRIIGVVLALFLMAVHGKAAMDMKDPNNGEPTKQAAPKDAWTTLIRTVLMADGAAFIAFAVFRLLLGVDELSQIPDQAQGRLAVPYMILFGVFFLLMSLQGNDYVTIRSAFVVASYFWFVSSAFFTSGNIAPGYMISLAYWVARGVLGLHIAIFFKSWLSNGIFSLVRSMKLRFTKLGRGVEGFGEE